MERHSHSGLFLALLVGLALAVPAAADPPKAQPLPQLTDETADPAVWGRIFPSHYELYLKTREMQPTKYGGSKAVKREPTDADPRAIVSQTKVGEDAGLKAMWQGYAFAADFREERGHAYMLEDQKYTLRQKVVQQPGACLNCHASMYVPFKKAGEGDIAQGFRKINPMPYSDAAKLVEHPVACIDCHDPNTLELRVTRPAFIDGMRAYKASLGVPGYDVNKQATREEKRAYVCGQCHVEYYFKGPEKLLVYPWSKGLKVDEIQAFYDEAGFRDFTHKDTGAPALKAQHPEFELWSQGLHARSGVTCSDCHMPNVKHNGTEMTDHWVRSPVLNLQNACVSCHSSHDSTVTANEMKGRIEQIQDRHWALRQQAMTAVTALIADLKAAKEAGRPDEELAAPRYLQRRAQFYLDFIEAENSTGFHAPQEAARVLGEAIDYARQGQLALRDRTFKPTVSIVNIPPPPAPAAPPVATAAAAK